MTETEILRLKHDLNDPWLRDMCFWFGIIWLTRVINHCLNKGFGILGYKRINKDFFQSLSENDRAILKKVSDWIESQ